MHRGPRRGVIMTADGHCKPSFSSVSCSAMSHHHAHDPQRAPIEIQDIKDAWVGDWIVLILDTLAR